MTYGPDTPPIQNYSLFGEAAELPDVVHCETIETRSRLHNWEFRPHRHDRLHQVLVIEGGGGSAVLDAQPYVLGPGALVNVPTGCAHTFKFQIDTRGLVVTLSTELLDETLRPGEGLGPVLSRAAVAASRPAHRALARQIFDEHAGGGIARAHILRSLSAQLLGWVARSLLDLDDSSRLGSDSLLRIRFERLLEANFRDHLGVADYARRLSVSSRHLSRVMRQSTGLSPSQVIAGRIIREARRQLFFTNLSVAQVAYLLGYDDPAYFTRVFTRTTGLSPRAFRQRIAGSP